jgi:mRNA interferase RelE/StbE
LLSNYKIFETTEFLKKVKKITTGDQAFIEKKLLQFIYPQLKEEPHYGNNIKKLIDYKPETWRYRIGKYRLFYVIDEIEKIVYILSIDLRKEAY